MAIEPASPALQADWLRTGVLIGLSGQDCAPGTTARPWLTVVVPTRDEESNVGPLLDRLGPVLQPLGADILFIDDSDDRTPEAVARSAPACLAPVWLLHRPRASRGGGLGSAVVTAAGQAAGSWLVVMDADLQHPPEAVGALAHAAALGGADIVAGSRYVGQGASADDGLGALRRLISITTTWLVKIAFPRRMSMISDPLSGLFAFRRGAVDLAGLRPAGFKILVEILVRNPRARVTEVPYRFAARHSGASKASVREGATFLRHLVKLRLARPARQRGGQASPGAGGSS